MIVTGSASGMGEASARGFAKAGAHVTIVDRNEAGARQVATKIGAWVQVGDVSDSAFCNAVVAATLAQYGRLDVLVNGVETTDEQ